MNVHYKWVNWNFDSALWASSIRHACDEHGLKEIAGMLSLSETTLINWKNGNYTEGFKYPNMTNFLQVCNLLDLEPETFFTVQEV